MNHQFKPGDRALKIPLRPGLPWEEVDIASTPWFSRSRRCARTGKRFGPALVCSLVKQAHWVGIDSLPFACEVKRLIPLPKNGPDAERKWDYRISDTDIARKLVELHGGE